VSARVNWGAVVELLDAPELDDEKFSNASERLANAEELGEILDRVFETKKKQEMFYSAHQQRFIFGVIDSPEEVLVNPQFEAREYFVDVEHPVIGSAKYPGAPFLMSGSPWEARQPAPTLGQHNREVLGERLGYSDADIAQLRATEVI
jgi:crotonobetainyl-CoA:carnitine CoA-transferase CaiB-like acyl-CoA transferase